jgi:hypothetical protein
LKKNDNAILAPRDWHAPMHETAAQSNVRDRSLAKFASTR